MVSAIALTLLALAASAQDQFKPGNCLSADKDGRIIDSGVPCPTTPSLTLGNLFWPWACDSKEVRSAAPGQFRYVYCRDKQRHVWRIQIISTKKWRWKLIGNKQKPL